MPSSNVVAGPMLAHKGRDKGLLWRRDYRSQAVPRELRFLTHSSCISNHAGCPPSEDRETEEAGVALDVGKCPYRQTACPRSTRTTDGFVNILADAKQIACSACNYRLRPRNDP